MQEFIQMAASKLGISESQAGSATGGILNLIKQHAAPADAQQLLAKLPGADSLLASAPQVLGASTGGGIGGMLGKVAGSMGGKAGGALGALAMLQGSGLDMSKISQFVPMFFNFIKGKAGNELVSRVLGKLPELAQMVH
jgi:hypothetical protein